MGRDCGVWGGLEWGWGDVVRVVGGKLMVKNTGEKKAQDFGLIKGVPYGVRESGESRGEAHNGVG
jgi:hypothetical protein